MFTYTTLFIVDFEVDVANTKQSLIIKVAREKPHANKNSVNILYPYRILFGKLSVACTVKLINFYNYVRPT